MEIFRLALCFWLLSGITDAVSRLRPVEDVINFREKTPAMKTREE
jgi:hypothetical protein